MRRVAAGGALLLLATPLWIRGSQKERQVPELALPPPARVVVVSASGREPAGLPAWSAAGKATGVEVEGARLAELLSLDPGRFGAIVVEGPGTLPAELPPILESVAVRGIGLVLTGKVAHPGHWTPEPGERMLELLFPAHGFSDLRASPQGLRVGLRGPLSAGLAPGDSIPARLASRPLAATGRGPLAWIPVGAGERSTTAALHGAFRGAPVAWLAVDPSALPEDPRLERVLANLLRWAVRRPIADLAAWPGGRGSAAWLDPDGVGEEGWTTVAERPPAVPQLAGDRVEIPRSAAALRAAGVGPLVAEALGGFAAAARIGGLWVMPPLPEATPEEARLAVRAGLRAELESRRTWLADGREIARWWRVREALRVTLLDEGPGLLRVRLENRGAEPAREATARVYLPPGWCPPSALAGWWPRGGVVRVAWDRSWVEVVARRIGPGSERTYTLQ